MPLPARSDKVLSVGAGMAIAQRMDKTGTRVYVLIGDGEMAEGQVWEAAEFAGHYKLDNLTVLADVNALGQSEPTMYQHDMEVYRKKFDAEGFATEVIDGHDVAAVLAALDRAKAVKGKPASHHRPHHQRTRRRFRRGQGALARQSRFPRTSWPRQ